MLKLPPLACMVVAVVMMIVPQQPGAGQIHRQAEHRHRNRLVEGDGLRVEQAVDALGGDHDRGAGQDHAAGEGGEVPDLAGAEGEARVGQVAARIEIGRRRDQHGPGVRGHVDAVCQQGHGVEHQPADDLDDHHGRAEDDHRPGAALVGGVVGAQENMVVPQGVEHRVVAVMMMVIMMMIVVMMLAARRGLIAAHPLSLYGWAR